MKNEKIVVSYKIAQWKCIGRRSSYLMQINNRVTINKQSARPFSLCIVRARSCSFYLFIYLLIFRRFKWDRTHSHSQCRIFMIFCWHFALAICADWQHKQISNNTCTAQTHAHSFFLCLSHSSQLPFLCCYCSSLSNYLQWIINVGQVCFCLFIDLRLRFIAFWYPELNRRRLR